MEKLEKLEWERVQERIDTLSESEKETVRQAMIAEAIKAMIQKFCDEFTNDDEYDLVKSRLTEILVLPRLFGEYNEDATFREAIDTIFKITEREAERQSREKSDLY